MSVNQIIKTVKPLSNDELLKVAPSIFSENPIEGVSDKYAFVCKNRKHMNTVSRNTWTVFTLLFEHYLQWLFEHF